MQYFFANGSEQRGPYSLDELAALGLRPDTLVWREGLSDWQRADSIQELLARIPIARASTPSAGSDKPAFPISDSSDDTEIPLAPPEPSVSSPPISPPVASAMLGYHRPTDSEQANGMAVAALVLGIVSIPALCLQGLGALLGILAIIFGFIARARARRDGLGGAGLALAGIICGFISVALVAVVLTAIVIIMMKR